LKSLANLSITTIAVIISYYLVDKFQIYLLTGINAQSSENLFASYIYLPHGVRVIVTYVFGLNTFLGLFIAHIITGLESLSENNLFIITASFFSAISPLIAIYFVFKKFNLNLKDIKIANIIKTAVISSLLNSFFSVSIRYFFKFYKSGEIFSLQFLQFLVGDILGVLFLFLILILFLNLKKIIFKS